MRAAVAAALLLVLAAGAFLWMRTGDEAEIRRRLYALVDEINDSNVDGIRVVARAAEIGAFFTEDTTILLGTGAAPIEGRSTLIGMAARLQPRVASFSVRLSDIVIHLADDRRSADVSLTVQTTRRASDQAPDQANDMDAQEFALEMRKDDGEWRIARMSVVEVFKQARSAN